MWNQFKETWHILGEPIYLGDRLKANLRALTLASIVTALLGLVLTVMDLRSHDTIMLSAALATFVFASACCFCAGVLKNRELAGLFPTLFCAVVFTIYSVTGVGEGSAMLWTLLMPIGISYFVSVRNGILLSAYYAVLFGVLFHSPLKAQMSAYYTPSFMQRLPLLFDCQALLTGIAMVQYHRMARAEIRYADRLNEEVDRKTRAVREQAKRLSVLNEEMVETLAVTIDAKDRYTNGHSFRVSWYSVALAEKLGWSDQELKHLERETLLHDIGKIGVPDAVLNKPGRLTDEEFAIIQSHTTVGGNILSRTASLKKAAEVARYHHERYDGHGYPEGRAGEDIPAHARVAAIADAYDAMHSDRIYRKGLPHDVVRAELVRGRGRQFDPYYLDVFLELFDSGALDRVVQQREADMVG